MIEVCELAALDGSLGWLAAMFNAGAHEVANLPDHAADQVWGSAPEAVIACGYGGQGHLVGRRLTGRWQSVVGAEFAEWLLLPADNGAARVLLPSSAARLEPVPDITGLRRAGIRDVTVSDLTVDDNGSFSIDDYGAGMVAAAGAAAAVVGSADGVWRRHVEHVRARLATSFGGDEVTDTVAAQVAWAASDIDAAKLQITESLHQRAGLAAAAGIYQQAVTRARGAADRLLGNSRHALDASDHVTELWRDVHAGGRVALRMLHALQSMESSRQRRETR